MAGTGSVRPVRLATPWSAAGRNMPGHARRSGPASPGISRLGTSADPVFGSLPSQRSAHRALAEDLLERLRTAAVGGPGASRKRHTEPGQAPPRAGLEHLLDPGTPFLELSPLAANGMYDDECPAAGLITGIGRVSGRRCVIVANDATVKGGHLLPVTVKKHLRAQEVAGKPVAVHLPGRFRGSLPAGPGRRLPRPGPFRTDFYNQANLSAAGMAQSRPCSDRAPRAAPTCLP